MGEIIHDRTVKIELYNDHFENAKRYQIPRAQLIIADIPYCYDTETECLTKNGWKRYNEITYEDEVLSLEPNSQQMEWSKIKNIIIRENDKTLLHFKNQNMDFMVTENHRMFVYSAYNTLKNGKSVTKTKKDGVRLAKDITQSCYIPRNNYKWGGTDMKFVIIPECSINTNGDEHIEQEKKIDINIWLEFFGLWLADGCTCNSKAKNGRQLYTVSIKQAGKNRKRVSEILEKLPFRFHEYENKGTNESNFNIYSKQLWIYLKQFGKSNEKYIPREFLDLPKQRLKILWESYTFGDSTKNGNGLKISTISKQLIENLQEVALKLGVVCQIRQAKYDKWTSKLYYFQFGEQMRNIRYPKADILKYSTQTVWCLTLETNSIFLVRRNGIINFCGNCIGKNAYGSRSDWYIDGDSNNGESKKANSEFFDTDKDFKIYNFFQFCTRLLKKEPKETGKAPCMIVFCSWQQLNSVSDYAKQFGFMHSQPLFFIKKSSSQVLKANMRVCGATECALVLYRDKLPKFNNDGHMILDWFPWDKGGKYPKIHPTQKPVEVLKQLIRIYTDEYDVVIDPVAGSGSTLRACAELNRSCYGFEIKKDFYKLAKEKMLTNITPQLF